MAARWPYGPDMQRDARARGLTIRVGIAPPPQLRAVDDLWRFVDALEELGYDSIWLTDSATRTGLASVPALAAIAARTRRLKLGANVFVLPARNPVLLAKGAGDDRCDQLRAPAAGGR